MAAPSITAFNGQIKTPWRGGYTSASQLTENTLECRDEMEACPFRLFWKNDTLPPFQFIRPGSMAPITSWKLYDGPGDDATELVDLTDQIGDLVRYHQTSDVNGFAKDVVYYLGSPLQESLDAGTYYMRIESGETTYLWEPITVVCETYKQNALPDLLSGPFRSEANPDAPWEYVGDHPLMGLINVAGAPSNPEWEFLGAMVANIADDSLYTYNGSTWVQDTSPEAGEWFDGQTGNFYRFNTTWQGIPAPVYFSGGAIHWRGTYDFPIFFNLSFIECIETNVRFLVNVAEVVQGTLGVVITGDGDDDPDASADAAGELEFVAYTANGYGIEFVPSDGFEGSVDLVAAYCQATMSECYYRLDWSNCGSVGNTFSGDGFTHAIYLEQAVYPVRPAPEVTVESTRRADGSTLETSRRRETTWTLDIGNVPWFIADALADIPLYDTVTMNPVGGGTDRLTLVRVSVENDEDFAECYKRVQITFQNESATAACCDDFEVRCRTSCVDAFGLTTDHDQVDGFYLLPGESSFAYFDTDTFGTASACASGLARIVDSEFEVLYYMYFNLNEGEWAAVAAVVDVQVTAIGGGACTINILAVVAPGFRAVLQYKNTNGDWVDDDQYDLTADEWVDNHVARATPEDEGEDAELRIMVYIGDCELGYGAEFSYECGG